MTSIDPHVLAEKAAACERHLRRVSQRLPSTAGELEPMSDASDAVILHLWQATQIVVDMALSACVHLGLGTPSSYADAFDRLSRDAGLDPDLAERLGRAAGFRNWIAHAYESIDMTRVYRAARDGPEDLRAFIRWLRDRAASSAPQAT